MVNPCQASTARPVDARACQHAALSPILESVILYCKNWPLPGANTVKANAAITWVGVGDGLTAEVRMYDRLFIEAQPNAGGENSIEGLNPNSLKTLMAIVESP